LTGFFNGTGRIMVTNDACGMGMRHDIDGIRVAAGRPGIQRFSSSISMQFVPHC